MVKGSTHAIDAETFWTGSVAEGPLEEEISEELAEGELESEKVGVGGAVVKGAKG